MATARILGRYAGRGLVGIVGLPLAIAATIPVAIGSVGLAISPHSSRFWRLHKEIGEDLKQIELISENPGHVHHEYYLRQLAKYLRPDERPANTWTGDLKNLGDFFRNKKITRGGLFQAWKLHVLTDFFYSWRSAMRLKMACAANRSP